MEKQRTQKVITVIALIVAVIGVTIAFAAMSTVLTINGTAKMETASWRILFLDGSLTSDKTGDATIVTEPQLSDTNIGTFSVILTKPGDSVTYTFNVVNDGNMNAKIGTLIKNGIEIVGTETINPTCTGLADDPTDAANDASLVCENLTYTLNYADGPAVKVNDRLLAQDNKKLTLTLSYDGTKLPTDDVEITGLDITIIYIQE